MAEFKDVNGRDIKLGDYVYHAASARSSAWLNRYIVVGFTNTMLRVLTPEKRKRWDRSIRGISDEELWPTPRNVKAGDKVVVVNDEWPEAEQYIREMGL